MRIFYFLASTYLLMDAVRSMAFARRHSVFQSLSYFGHGAKWVVNFTEARAISNFTKWSTSNCIRISDHLQGSHENRWVWNYFQIVNMFQKLSESSGHRKGQLWKLDKFVILETSCPRLSKVSIYIVQIADQVGCFGAIDSCSRYLSEHIVCAAQGVFDNHLQS